MKITILIENNGTTKTELEVLYLKGAAQLPAMQLQDALIEYGAQMLDDIINCAAIKGMTDADDLVNKITLEDIKPNEPAAQENTEPGQPQ